MTAITALPILRYMVPTVSLLMVFAAAALEHVAMQHLGPLNQGEDHGNVRSPPPLGLI
jgi:hypothetical protein